MCEPSLPFRGPDTFTNGDSRSYCGHDDHRDHPATLSLPTKSGCAYECMNPLLRGVLRRSFFDQYRAICGYSLVLEHKSRAC